MNEIMLRAEVKILVLRLSQEKARADKAEAHLNDIVRGKCAIKDCTNKPSEGVFVGSLCSPCANTNYKTDLASEREVSADHARRVDELERELERAKAEIQSHHEEYEQVCGYKKLIDARGEIERLKAEIASLRNTP